VTRHGLGTEGPLRQELGRPQQLQHRQVAEHRLVRAPRREQPDHDRRARPPVDPEHAHVQLLHLGGSDAEGRFEMGRQRVDAPAPVHARERGVEGGRGRVAGHKHKRYAVACS
jgi:hypothetical protein